jgi:uncharacterized membrane protein YfcA
VNLALALGFGLLIGLSLGALGGGGSILTVPALVYAVGESARSATTASLVIVGVTAGAATWGHARAGRVRWRAGSAFGTAGVAASFAGTKLNARVNPQVLLICFAVLMIIAATAMLARTMVHVHPEELRADTRADQLRRGPAVTRPEHPRMGLALAFPVLAAGIVVGFLTGFLGVGGGFVIVPALVLTLGYEMPTAVGTSLLIISLNSLVALVARGGHSSFHWSVIIPFTIAAIVGSAGGRRLSGRASGAQLTRAFAVLLLIVAGYVLLRASLG